MKAQVIRNFKDRIKRLPDGTTPLPRRAFEVIDEPDERIYELIGKGLVRLIPVTEQEVATMVGNAMTGADPAAIRALISQYLVDHPISVDLTPFMTIAAATAKFEDIDEEINAIRIDPSTLMTKAAAEQSISDIMASIPKSSNDLTDGNTLAHKNELFDGSYQKLSGKPDLFDKSFNSLTNKPSAYPPMSHEHAISDITGLVNAMAGKQPTGDYLTQEQDPTVSSFVKSITAAMFENGNLAYGWGNHAGLYRPISYVPSWNEITGKPTLFNGSYSDLVGKPSLSAVATSGSYADLTGKPTSFPTSWADVSNKPALFDGTWASLTGKPSTFTPSAHTHATSDITGFDAAVQAALDSMYVVNNTTVGLSKSQLNTQYPNAKPDFKVKCPNILLGGAIYIKVSGTGASGIWQLVSAPPVA